MGKTILVADDSRTIQKVVELTFDKTDFSVITASDGREALARATDERPDIILADVTMPGADGYQVCSALKSRPDTRSIAVVLLASGLKGLDRVRAEEAHADAHIDKPFDTQELISLVNRVTGVTIDGALPLSFAATLAQRRSETDPAASNDHARPPPEGDGASISRLPPPEEALIDAGESLEMNAVTGSPYLEPPPPPDAPPAAANVDIWALGDGASAEAARNAIEEVSIEEEEPIPVANFQEAHTPVPIARRVSERAAAPVADSVHPLMPDLPREELARIAREVIEKVAWEVVPELAETLLREEIDRLLEE